MIGLRILDNIVWYTKSPVNEAQYMNSEGNDVPLTTEQLNTRVVLLDHEWILLYPDNYSIRSKYMNSNATVNDVLKAIHEMQKSKSSQTYLKGLTLLNTEKMVYMVDVSN